MKHLLFQVLRDKLTGSWKLDCKVYFTTGGSL